MIEVVIILAFFVVIAPMASLIWLWRLSKRVDELKQKLAVIANGDKTARDSEQPKPVAATQVRERSGDRPTIESAPADTDDAIDETPTVIPAVARKSDDAATTQPAKVDRPPESIKPQKPEGPTWEERLAANWMVWLGGVTVALAAVFMFSYAIDQGYLTPLARVVLGLLGGGALLAGGEWAQRTPALVGRFTKVDYVPSALTAAGIFAILASLYSAHALYGLIGPVPAFLTMGMTAYASLGLALRQGWFVAALGTIAGYLIPALISTSDPNAAALFIYLFVLTLGALALMVWRQWRWFSVLTLIGSLGWPLLWMIGSWPLTEQGVVSLYLLGLAAAFAVLSTRLPIVPEKTATMRWVASVVSHSSGLGFAMSGVLLIVMAELADFNGAAFTFVAVYAALALGLGIWRTSLESLLIVAALVVLGAVLVWPQPHDITLPTRLQELGVDTASNAFGPYVMPPEFFAFSRALWAFAALFGVGAFLGLSRVLAKTAWAGMSALMPILMFIMGYWRIGGFEVAINWSLWAVGLSVVLLLATISVNRRLPNDMRDEPVALYAAGVTAAIALIFTCLLREAWLTVALAVEIAAIAWIWSRLQVQALKTIALAVLAVVVMRLTLNPQILTYDGAILGSFGWVIYGYGIPAAATFFAARIFARNEKDLTATLCEIASVGFAFLMVATQLKLWTSGSIYTPRWDALDSAVQANWWIVVAGLLLYRPFAESRPWATMAGQGVLAAAAFLIVGGLLVSNNPLFTLQPVGNWPIFNLLGAAYLLPAIMLIAMASSRQINLADSIRQAMIAGSGILIFIDLTLEVRRAFWGNVIALGPDTLPQNAEIYAYSAVWTVFSLVLLALGIRWKSQAFRYASLAVLLITVAKVFLFDMSDLTGLYRVVSFLGLGLTLIGIGRVYQRFVFTTPEDAVENDVSA